MTTIGVVLGIFATLLIILQLVIVINAKKRRGRRILGVGGPLGEAVNSGERVLAYFYSPTCAECRTQTPIIDILQREYPNVYKVDVGEHFEAARAFGVMATPTTVLVDQSKIVDTFVGTRSEAVLREALL